MRVMQSKFTYIHSPPPRNSKGEARAGDTVLVPPLGLVDTWSWSEQNVAL